MRGGRLNEVAKSRVQAEREIVASSVRRASRLVLSLWTIRPWYEQLPSKDPTNTTRSQGDSTTKLSSTLKKETNNELNDEGMELGYETWMMATKNRWRPIRKAANKTGWIAAPPQSNSLKDIPKIMAKSGDKTGITGN